MQKNSKILTSPDGNQNKISHSEITAATSINTETATHVEIGKDWQNQLALKNAAILKSIEDLIDAALKTPSDEA